MAINFKPFEELFAPAYQLTYISADGHIDVDLHTYSVFHYYTMQERQVIFQVCEKHLPWESTQEQEQWERTMYMYQYVIKSPPPFPYEEYSLSGDIIMAITWEVEITPVNVAEKLADVSATATDSENVDNPITVRITRAKLDTPQDQLSAVDRLYSRYLSAISKSEIITTWLADKEAAAKVNLEARI